MTERERRQLPPLPDARRLTIAAAVEVYFYINENSRASMALSDLIMAIPVVVAEPVTRRLLFRGTDGLSFLVVDRDDEVFLTDEGLDFIIESQASATSEVSNYLQGSLLWIHGAEPAEDALAVEEVLKSAPASDRYVSVSDNQPKFEELLVQLDKIRSAFADDHKKNELGGEEGLQLLSEIASIEAQVKSFWVRTKQLTDGLTPALEKAARIYPGIAKIAEDAIKTVKSILEAIGFTS